MCLGCRKSTNQCAYLHSEVGSKRYHAQAEIPQKQPEKAGKIKGEFATKGSIAMQRWHTAFFIFKKERGSKDG